MKPKVLILFAPGTNFDEETKYAFEKAEAVADVIPMGEVIKNPKLINKYQILDFPGGFSYGDDLLAGKIWANQVRIYMFDTIQKFLKKGGIILGVCNGFQALMRSGLLPGFGELHKTAGLIFNEKQKFECRWIKLKMSKNRCVFLKNLMIDRGELPVQHGEGRFLVSDNKILQELILENQVVFQYTDQAGKETMLYPDNPNGSVHSIAGICDTSGQILGMMPHPEHFVHEWQHPNFRRMKIKGECFGFKIYKSAVKFCQTN